MDFSKIEKVNSKIKAYNIFDKFIAHDLLNDTDILKYIKDPDSKFKEELLSCMSDWDFEINDDILLQEIKFLVSSSNKYTATTAALTLLSGGKKAHAILFNLLNKNKIKYNSFILKCIKLAQDSN